MDILRTEIQKIINLTDEDWSLFEKTLTVKHVKAKTQIIKNGNIARDFFYIQKGLLRIYHLKEGKEINTYFACDNQFVSTYLSIITQKPSFEILETLEDSIVYAINYSKLGQLYNQSSKFERLGRILAEKNYLCIVDRTIMMQTQIAKEKYLNFIDSYDPRIIQQVPQRHIASFLGVTPESLSRVRKDLASSRLKL